jgi:hypothetical protein
LGKYQVFTNRESGITENSTTLRIIRPAFLDANVRTIGVCKGQLHRISKVSKWVPANLPLEMHVFAQSEAQDPGPFLYRLGRRSLGQRAACGHHDQEKAGED